MNCDPCCNDACSTCIEIVIAIILAAAVGVLFAFEYIAAITTALWIVFGLAALNLVLLILGLYTASVFRRTPLARCLFCRGGIFLAGIIGTIVLALASLSVGGLLVTGEIWCIVLISFTAFFAALMGVELIMLLCCIIRGLAPWPPR